MRIRFVKMLRSCALYAVRCWDDCDIESLKLPPVFFGTLSRARERVYKDSIENSLESVGDQIVRITYS